MSHQWCKCRGTYVEGGCNVKTHWTTVGPGLRAGQADYENCSGPIYSQYQTAIRNPIDFTPKSWYKEMDENAAYVRRLRRHMVVVDTFIGLAIGATIGYVLVALFR